MVVSLARHEGLQRMGTQGLGEFIAKRLSLLGMYQKDLAAKADISPSKISRLVKGHEVAFPSPEELQRMADVLGCTVDDLLMAAGYLSETPDTGTDDYADDARIYTMIERNQHLTAFQRQLIRMAWEESERRRKELEG